MSTYNTARECQYVVPPNVTTMTIETLAHDRIAKAVAGTTGG